MHATERPRTTERMLGFGGLLLALAGASGIVVLSDLVANNGSGPPVSLAIALMVPLLVATILLLTPAIREHSLIWLVTGVWTGFMAALTIFSVGIIFLIATVLLLAAFLKANWGNP